jgi:predicted transcriptional regulator
MKALRTLRELAKAKAIGPAPSFTELHLLKAIEKIKREGPIGRAKLSEELGLGEGATRTIISHLRDSDMIEVSKAGCILKAKGSEILEGIEHEVGPVVQISKSPITVGDRNVGILVKRAAHKVRYGVEQRDAAIRIGAVGATTLLYTEKKLSMPPIEPCISTEWPEVAADILEAFNPEENDVIIISGGDTVEQAENGARAAAWTLIEDH